MQLAALLFGRASHGSIIQQQQSWKHIFFSPKKTHHPSGTERENMAKNSMGFVGDIDLLQLSRQKKNLNGGLIGILIMVYYNPYISEVGSISLSQWTLK